MYRRVLEMMPSEMLRVKPNGEPRAMTNCPASTASLSAKSAVGSAPRLGSSFSFSSARSVSGSSPTTVAGTCSRSPRTQLTSMAFSQTWLLLTA